MDLNEALHQLSSLPGPLPRQEKLAETIQRAKDCRCLLESSRPLTRLEFLLSQLRYTRKRWWALQALLLALGSHLLPQLEPGAYRIRTLGVLACLFTVALIPELWRNKASHSTQVEAASLYSLRQIYAARLTLFGVVDIFLLTLFCLRLGRLSLPFSQIIAQFLLPAAVTACLCFRLFSGGPALNEAVSLTLCLTFGGAWLLLVQNAFLYAAIAPWVWLALFALAVTLLLLLVHRTLRTTNHTWEIDYYGITAH